MKRTAALSRLSSDPVMPHVLVVRWGPLHVCLFNPRGFHECDFVYVWIWSRVDVSAMCNPMKWSAHACAGMLVL
jgi:hypothetical protein